MVQNGSSLDVAIRDIENRDQILFPEAVFEEPGVCVCFGRIVMNGVLLISVDSYFIEGIGAELANFREVQSNEICKNMSFSHNRWCRFH